eukprot:9087088-Pyramimonas_sp.AAC.1
MYILAKGEVEVVKMDDVEVAVQDLPSFKRNSLLREESFLAFSSKDEIEGVRVHMCYLESGNYFGEVRTKQCFLCKIIIIIIITNTPAERHRDAERTTENPPNPHQGLNHRERFAGPATSRRWSASFC